MSGLFGGGGSNPGQVAPAYTGLQLQTSSGIVCVPLVWGQARGAPNVIWYGDFSAKAQHASGKGAGPTIGYDYHASLIMALSEGPIHGVGKCWVNTGNAVGISGTHFTLTSYGNTPQAPWSYLVSHYPTEADSYNGIAYVTAVNYDLGSTPYAPSTSFEVYGLRWGTAPNGMDADPALIIEDFIADQHTWSVGIPVGQLGNLLSTSLATTTGDNAYQTYCRAMGFGLSPFLQNQEDALSILQRWTELTNTAVYWSGYALKFVPYGDETVTANGVTYLPNLTPVYSIDYDYINLPQKDNDPIELQRIDPADAYNSVRLEFNHREQFYDSTPVQIQDLNLVQLYGVRQKSSTQASEVCEPLIAASMIELMLSRAAYIRNSYTFTLPSNFCLLEPMDVLELTDSAMGTFTCRITDMEENDDDTFKIVAEQLTIGLSSPGASTLPQTVTNTPQNSLAIPDSVNPPIIFEPPSTLTNGQLELWAAVSGGSGGVVDPNWGGCNIFVSTDGGVTYGSTPVGTITGPARMGTLTANLAAFGGTNPDNTNTLSVNLSESGGSLSSVSATDAANAVTLCYCDGELLSYETATLTSTYHYGLTTLYRGLYGTTAASHLSGANFARLDASVFQYPVPAQYIGTTLYFKFQSFNVFGQQAQDLSTCTAYSFTVTGGGTGGGSGGVPTIPTGLTATGITAGVKTTWNLNPSSDFVTFYTLWRAPGASAMWSAASPIWSGLASGYNDVGLPSATSYTYFLTATNSVGRSTNTSGVNATTL